MNAPCLSNEHGITQCESPDANPMMSMEWTGDEDLAYDARDENDDFEQLAYELDFDDCDAVERHARRRVAVELAFDVAVRNFRTVHATQAASLLIWSAPHLPTEVLQSLVGTVLAEGEEDARNFLALWRGGALERDDLQLAAQALLDTARVELALEQQADSAGRDCVIEGPWRRAAPPIDRVHQLHVVLLAMRHAALEIDGVAEQILELWQEELRAELSACTRALRQRELRPRDSRSPSDEEFSATAHLLAAAAELWRDTAPAARPLRVPLEQLTRWIWQTARFSRLGRAERAALLIAAGNQRLDDLPLLLVEAPLHGASEDGRPMDTTWVGGRRPRFSKWAAGDDPGAEALVIRALSGPARTGPRRS